MTSVKMTDLLIAFPQSVCLFDKLFNIVAEALDHKTHFKTWIFQYGSETIFFFSFFRRQEGNIALSTCYFIFSLII